MARYAKFAAAAAGAVVAGLDAFAPGAHWLPAVTAAITAAVVYLVPNTRGPQPPAAA